MNAIKCTIFFFFATQLLGYEVDNFTNRRKIKNLKDSVKQLDKEVNQRIKNVVKEMSDYGCHEETLLDYLKGDLDNNPVGELEEYAVDEKKIQKFSPADDVYKGASALSGLVMFVAGLEPSINLHGHVVGIDKLGHFFSQGYEYFINIQMHGNSLINSLKKGEKQENGKYGLSTTGIKSYGDLAANFSGLSFWERVLFGDNPYVVCKNDKFVINSKFTFKDYVNDSWDQAINCSDFNGEKSRAVKENLKKLKLQCPVDIAKCQKIAKLNCAEKIISPHCLKVATNVNRKCVKGKDQRFDPKNKVIDSSARKLPQYKDNLKSTDKNQNQTRPIK